MQKELNLEVGQKVWSIQLGDCEVCFKDDKLITCTNCNIEKEYYLNGKMFHHDYAPSLFLSNPFEPRLVQENKDVWIEPKENKAELINALCNIRNSFTSSTIIDTTTIKLQKLLESL